MSEKGLRDAEAKKKKKKKKQGKRVLRMRKKEIRVLIILQDERPNNVGFDSNLTW